MAVYEVTFTDTGYTETINFQEAVKKFGVIEFKEIIAGYLPNIVAVRVG